MLIGQIVGVDRAFFVARPQARGPHPGPLPVGEGDGARRGSSARRSGTLARWRRPLTPGPLPGGRGVTERGAASHPPFGHLGPVAKTPSPTLSRWERETERSADSHPPFG